MKVGLKYTVSIVIPLLNEQDILPELLKQLDKYLERKKNNFAEVVFVDDGSSDRSMEILLNAGPCFFKKKVIKLSRNFGSHAALRAGVLNASAPVIMFMSADIQDPPELLDKLMESIVAGFDIAWGYRRSVHVSLVERFFSRLYARMMRKFAVPVFPDNNLDVVIFNEKVKKELNESIEANSSIFLQILSMGFKQDLVPYDRQRRQAGCSKWTLSKKIKLLIDSFVAFSYTPIRLVTVMGITISMLGILWVLYIVLRALLIGDLDPGWPSLIGILIIGFGLTNISLGIIAEYLWRTLDAARGRKVFIVEKIYDLDSINASKRVTQ